MPLESPDRLHRRTAVGYIELGMFEDPLSRMDQLKAQRATYTLSA